ncbi:hypothetical protein DENSPDRAFT_887041 [Dentipellis sp. KUC8613]|nr:hypothetical protein DENSPDRAFT_887041 [Dentipellis sp. KUC8613]
MTSHPLAPRHVRSPRLTPSSNAAACAISPRSRPSCRLARPRNMLHAFRCALRHRIDALLRLSTPSHAVWRRMAAVSPRGAVLPRLGSFSPVLSFHARERDAPSPPNNAAHPTRPARPPQQRRHDAVASPLVLSFRAREADMPSRPNNTTRPNNAMRSSDASRRRLAALGRFPALSLRARPASSPARPRGRQWTSKSSGGWCVEGMEGAKGVWRARRVHGGQLEAVEGARMACAARRGHRQVGWRG